MLWDRFVHLLRGIKLAKTLGRCTPRPGSVRGEVTNQGLYLEVPPVEDQWVGEEVIQGEGRFSLTHPDHLMYGYDILLTFHSHGFWHGVDLHHGRLEDTLGDGAGECHEEAGAGDVLFRGHQAGGMSMKRNDCFSINASHHLA